MGKIKIKAIDRYKEQEIEINKDSRIAFITGAGVSVGSGLPTYYGDKGVYTKLKEKPEDVLNPFNMRNNPHIIWNELSQLIVRGHNAPASLSHQKIAEIEALAGEAMVVTQNVDSLHEKGGAKNVLHIHGEASRSFCTECELRGVFNHYKTLDVFEDRTEELAPKCPECGQHHIVPDIVPFEGQFDPVIYDKMNAFFQKSIDVCFVVGTQLQFQHIEMLLHFTQLKNPNALIIDINPDVDYHNYYAKLNYKMKSDIFFKDLIIEI